MRLNSVEKARKRSLSGIVLVVAFVAILMLMAVTAYAADYDLWVDGVRVTSDNASNILGNGSAVYSASENVLYLDGATLSEVALWRGTEEDPEWEQYRAAIGSKIPGLTINLSGSNAIYVDGSYYDGIDTDYNCDLTITGSGTLSVQTPGGYGMYISGWDWEPTTGSLTITGGASVNVKSALTGIWVHENITFDNCSVQVDKDNDAYFGIVCNTGRITVSNSDVKVNSVCSCIELGNGETHDYGFIMNSGNVELTVSGDTDDDKAISAFPYELATITVNGGTLTITSVTGGTIIPDENITIAAGLEFSEGTSLRDTGRVVVGEAGSGPDDERTLELSASDDKLREKVSGFLRKALKDRVPVINLEINGAYSDFDNDFGTWGNNWYNTEEYEIWKAATEHTGVPDEGDYLAYTILGHELNINLSGTSYDDITATITYTVSYPTTYEQEKTVEREIRNVLNSLNIEGKSDYVKVREIYGWICRNVTYDHANLNNSSYKLKYTAYAALINRTALCQGYANLFYRMALTAGVDARIVSGYGYGKTGAAPAFTGSASNGWERHGWNIVKLGNLYYNLDATWDATMLSSTGGYRFFLRGNSQNEFTQKHIRQPYAILNDQQLYQDPTSAEFNTRHPMDQNDYVVKYSIAVTSADEDQGIAEITGQGSRYEYGESKLGTSVVIKATAKSGYSFKEWKQNGQTYSTAPELSVVLGEADLQLEAVFEVKQQSAYTAGDLDGDGQVELADVILLLQHSLFPDFYPVNYPGSLDFNHDGVVNISDVVKLLQHVLFANIYPLD